MYLSNKMISSARDVMMRKVCFVVAGKLFGRKVFYKQTAPESEKVVLVQNKNGRRRAIIM